MEQQYTEFYRCHTCAKAYEITDLTGKGQKTCKCGSAHFIPARLTFWELSLYLITHPVVIKDTLVAKIKGEI